MFVEKYFLTALLGLVVLGCSGQAGEILPTTTPSMAQSSPPVETRTAQASESPSPSASPSGSASPAGKYHGLTPFPDATAPEITEVTVVKLKTDLGDLLIEVYPQAAPNASKRFLELVKSGFYDDTPIFRVIPNFMAQMGINWRAKHKDWKDKLFKDDPSLFKLLPATVCFAKAGPDINSTQIFINYRDNSTLRSNGNFTTFARVTKGMDLATQFKHLGDPEGGLEQGALWGDGEAYLKSLPEQPNKIIKAEIVKPEGEKK